MNQKAIYSTSLYECVSTPSTLLIPKNLYSFFETCICHKNQSIGTLVSSLIFEFRGFILAGRVRLADGYKTQYQQSGQNLKRIAFRPAHQTWIELGQLAAFAGVSRCMLFVILLRLHARYQKNQQGHAILKSREENLSFYYHIAGKILTRQLCYNTFATEKNYSVLSTPP